LTALAAAYSYLPQAINCLVGSYDRDFDAKGPNRCQVLGLGTLIDSRDMTPRRQLEAAVAEAEWSLAAGDLAAATRNAAAAETTIRKAY